MHDGMEILLPKVEVEGVGVLSFPVPPVQIASLLQQSARAPYGRGAETILDESVRKVWQLPADKVRVSGKSWAATFAEILRRVVRGLGSEGMAVSAELYKLLIYDVGGFFLAHRDTEKAEGMFGTLVLVLPSAHRGGELVIRHAGREVTVEMSSAEVSEVTFAAFYADCEHEVRPITEGHRLCLVYNLLRKETARGKRESLRAPDYESQIDDASKMLQAALSAEDAPLKIAWLLEHQYSCESLSFAGLKSADAARVKVLMQAAERANCVVHLSIVHIEESGSAEGTYDGYGSRGWGRYDDEADDDGGEDFEVIEVCDGRQYVSHWRDPRDHPVEFGEIPLEPGELLPDGALDAEEPDEKRFMEASGNEGASFERWYRRAALVIWRRDRYAAVLLQAGIGAALPLLKEYIEAQECDDAPAAAREKAVALARQLIAACRPAPEDAAFLSPVGPVKHAGLLDLLNRLGDQGVLEKFIAEVAMRDYDGRHNAALVTAAMLLGPVKTGRLYADLMRHHLHGLPEQGVGLIHMLVTHGKLSTDPVWQRSLCGIAEAVVGQMDGIGKRPSMPSWQAWEVPKVNAVLVVKLMEALDALSAPGLCWAGAESIVARPDLFDPVTVLVPALGSLKWSDGAVAQLWEHSAAFILQRSGQPPAAPQDWRQDVRISCACEDCRVLQAFVRDPVQQSHRFRVRKDRRQHLHREIERHGLEMTHVTERVGSPQTLVCQKDRRGYRRRCEQYRQDIQALVALTALAREARFASALATEVGKARERAAEWKPA
ncbi:MAG: 2OG-Fe(II) oxygenase [Chthoniobacter sp.]